MRKSIRRVLAVLLTFTLAVSLAACGGGGKSEDKTSGETGKKDASSAPSMPQVTIKDGVVRTTEAKVDDTQLSMDGLQVLAVEKDRIYGFNYSYEGEGLEGNEFVSFKTDGSDLKKTAYKTKNEDEEIIASAFYGGNVYLGVAIYSNSPALDYALENGEDAEIPEDMSEDGLATYELRSVTPEGKENWAVKIQPEDEMYYYINSMYATEEGVMVVSSEGVDLFSAKDGSLAKTLCRVKTDEVVGLLYVLADGTVIMIDDSSMNNKVQVFNEGSGKFEEKQQLPSALQGATLFPGSKYSFYLAGDDGVYGVTLGQAELTPVVNFVNSDLDVQGIIRLVELEDGRLLMQGYASDNTVLVNILEPVAPEDVEDKKEITVAGYYIDSEVRTEVINFNKESSKYRIKVLDYSQYDLETDYDDSSASQDSTGLTRLNTDIVTGNAPDIMLLNPAMPVNSFISKGVFMDITDLYNADKDIEKEDFLKNVMDAFLTDGRMYVVVPSFTITGVSGKTKYIGDGKDLTLDKVREIAASRGINDAGIFGITERATVFHSAIEFSGDQFIDSDTNTCDFNNDSFKELLEFAKNCPETISEEQYNDYFTQYLSDKALLSIQYINTMYDYYYMTRQLFGDVNVTVTGFPSMKNQGPAIASSIQLGISNSASEPEGCWEFVRRFLLPEYQMAIESALPVSEKAIDAQGQKIIEQNKLDAQEQMEMGMLDGVNNIGAVDIEETTAPAEGDTAATGEEAAYEEGMDLEMEESEDLSGKPVSEKDFDGTHEEYEQYLEDEAANAAAAGTEEEVMISGDEITAAAEDEAAAGIESMPEFGQKDIDAMKAILKTLKYQVNGESEIRNIITEESNAYFAGQKSAEEVADIIQSRVQVYLKENE